jgi:hypothetical protein
MSADRDELEKGSTALNPTPLQIAIHEAGHAVAHLVLDDQPFCSAPCIDSVSIIPGDGFWGAVTVDPRLSRFARSASTDPHSIEAARQNQRLHGRYDIIEALAGSMAELYNEQPLLLPRLADRIIPKILTGQADDDSDCANIQKTIEWLEEDDPQSLLRELWDITYAIIASEWIGLEKVARVLRGRRVMSGGEFEAEWRKVRQPERVRSQREMRLSCTNVDWRAALVPAGLWWTGPGRPAVMA